MICAAAPSKEVLLWANVQELVKTLGLPSELGATLHPYVRDKYDELWRTAQTPEELDELP